MQISQFKLASWKVDKNSTKYINNGEIVGKPVDIQVNYDGVSELLKSSKNYSIAVADHLKFLKIQPEIVLSPMGVPRPLIVRATLIERVRRIVDRVNDDTINIIKAICRLGREPVADIVKNIVSIISPGSDGFVSRATSLLTGKVIHRGYAMYSTVDTYKGHTWFAIIALGTLGGTKETITDADIEQAVLQAFTSKIADIMHIGISELAGTGENVNHNDNWYDRVIFYRDDITSIPNWRMGSTYFY
ncbi:uncharacterized protein RJT21DRAFT_1849 [Scheffersomyces amazonensis]|uniref:uncharacterized protein n=1 Tax=Scheffersomyces amazonensis TaxID=1078765 RepID=UPI00315D45DD